MSKLTFSKQIKESMIRKLSALENLDFEEFMKKDEYFELALCIAYLTLSKEKIIEKDMDNPKRLDRLTKRVFTKDIDVLFKDGFSSEMPTINDADENDNIWILDNMRDSIMHEAIEIDEENNHIFINNTQHDRKLNGTIPFSWIIDYAKNDILKKKVLDNCNIRGFYYNKEKKEQNYLNTKKEIFSTILYTVNITGSRFNIKNIEDRISELFQKYSYLEINDTIKEKYQEEASKNNRLYDEKYLISFLYAKDLIIEQIEKEFPNVKLNIYINKHKRKIQKMASNTLVSYYKNYDLMYKQINQLVKPKGMYLLYNLSNIITKLGTINELDENKTIIERKNFINYILVDNIDEYDTFVDVYANFEKSMNILRTICFHVYGITSLVINNNDIYIPYYKEELLPITAYSRKKFLTFANERRSLELAILDEKLKLFDKTTQLDKYLEKEVDIDKDKIDMLKKSIEKIQTEHDKLVNKLNKLLKDNKIYINENNRNLEDTLKMQHTLKIYYEHFSKAKTKEDKYKVRKAISKLLNVQIEEESKYSYVYCNSKDTKEILTMIRNSISHIGRVKVKTNLNNNKKIIILNDYDNNHIHSGAVIGEYQELIDLLNAPLEEEKNKVKRKILKS